MVFLESWLSFAFLTACMECLNPSCREKGLAGRHGGVSDFNFDGIVDVTDLGIVGANFNATDMQWDTGDFNLDGMTDVADLIILGAN